LHENEPRYRRSAQIDVDPLDQERRAVLQFERRRGGYPQFQSAIAAKRLRPARGGDISADNCGPICFEAGEDTAAMPRDNRRGEPRGEGADRAQSGAALV
jgi:hypothetical protein